MERLFGTSHVKKAIKASMWRDSGKERRESMLEVSWFGKEMGKGVELNLNLFQASQDNNRLTGVFHLLPIYLIE